MQGSLLWQEEKVKCGMLLHTQGRLLWLQELLSCFFSRSWRLPTEQTAQDTTAVFTLELSSKKEARFFSFFFFSPMKELYFFSCLGWTVSDILGRGSDMTSNTAEYRLSFKEIEVFVMKCVLWMPHRHLHPSGLISYGE